MTQKLNTQKINAAYLYATAEVIEQLRDALCAKATEYILTHPTEYYKWSKCEDVASDLLACCHVRAELLEIEEAATLNAVARNGRAE